MVPMVFVYAPTMLIVIEGHFTLTSFLQVSLSCALGVFLIATTVAGYFLTMLTAWMRAVMLIAGLLLVAPSWESDIVGLVIMAAMILLQLSSKERTA